MPHETVWPLDDHTRAKHEILSGYLKAWFPILGSRHRVVRYVDGFCGPGRYSGGEPGSPLVAIDAARTHGSKITGDIHFWFIDERQDRIEHLREELTKSTLPSNRKVSARPGRFDEAIEPELAAMESSGSPPPSFFFIDPFGFKGIPFSTIARILKLAKCEVLINFMAGHMNRWLEHKDEKILGHIDQLFGTDDWRSIARDSDDRIMALQTLYQGQLAGVAKYVRRFEMRNRDDRPIYYLFFASNNRLGHTKMKEAMWRVDDSGEYRFSDAVDPSQMVLFRDNHDAMLAKNIESEFRQQEHVDCRTIRLYVEDETAFLKKHMDRAVRLLEKQGRIGADTLCADGSQRKGGTFKDEVVIRFREQRGGTIRLEPPPEQLNLGF